MINDADVRAMVIKQSRCKLIGVLKMFYPIEAGFLTLGNVLPTVERNHLIQDLAYLMDKKYATCVNERKSQSWDAKEFKLTAAGVEVADRIIQDKAIVD